MFAGIKPIIRSHPESSIQEAKILCIAERPDQEIMLKGYCVASSVFGENPTLRLQSPQGEREFSFTPKATNQLKRRFEGNSLNCGACRFSGVTIACDDVPATLSLISEDNTQTVVLADVIYLPVDQIRDALWAQHIEGRIDIKPLQKRLAELPAQDRNTEAGQLLEMTLGIIANGYEGPYEGRMIALGRQHKYSEAYQQYEKIITEALRPAHFSKHGFTYRFQDRPLTEAFWNPFRELLGYLSSEFGPAFVVSGTLLGLIRENNVLPHDDDIDIALLLSATNATDAADQWMALRRKLEALGKLNDDLMPVVGKPILKPCRIAGTPIDLFPAWIENGYLYIYPHTYGDLQESDLMPLKEHPTFKVPMPAEPEKMLAVNYGQTWRVPDPNARLEWGRWKRNFRPFLKNKAFDAW